MNPFEMVLGIIIVVTIGKVLRARFRAGAAAADTTAQESLETRQMREEIRSLRERIQVLERVVTDNNSSMRLDQEIEKLRDQNRV